MNVQQLDYGAGRMSCGSVQPEWLPGDVSRAATGDQEAFERLVEAHKSLVCSIALAIVRDLEASEEIAQDVFIAAWKQIGKLKNPASFLPWLRQVTRNRSHDFIRQRIIGRARVQTLADESKVAASDPREHLVQLEEFEMVREALEQLPDETREIVTLFYRENSSIRQVAELLELPEDTVKKRLSRARQRLKADVEGRFSDTLARTAPTATFTAGVMASLTFAAPVTATAAGLSFAAKAAPAVGMGFWAGIFAGLACGVAAIVGGKRKQLQKAWDEEERRGLRIAAIAEIAVMCGFLGVIVFWAYFMDTPLKDHPAAGLSLVALYWLGLNACILGWERKVTRRRREMQRIEEPEVWREEQRKNAWGLVVSISVLLVSLFGLGMALYLRAH